MLLTLQLQIGNGNGNGLEIIIDTDNEDHDDDDGFLDSLLMLLMMTISRHGQELVKNRFVVRNLNI